MIKAIKRWLFKIGHYKTLCYINKIYYTNPKRFDKYFVDCKSKRIQECIKWLGLK